MSFVDMNQADRAAYFRSEGGALVSSRDRTIDALSQHYDTLKRCGAFEGAAPDKERWIDACLHTMYARCAEEVTEYLAW